MDWESDSDKSQLITVEQTTTKMTGNLQSLKYSNESGKEPTLAVLDQLLIPHEKVYVDIPDVQAAWSVIRTMQIRGMFGASCQMELWG